MTVASSLESDANRRPPTVRRAGVDDIPELGRLRWSMTSEMRGATEDPMAFEERFAAFAGRALADDRWAAVVAVRGQRLLGMLWVQLVERVPRPTEAPRWSFAYVTSVFVEAEERNRGLGRLILDAAIAWAREGAADTEILLWPSERSVPFYERAGFRRSEAYGLEP